MTLTTELLIWFGFVLPGLTFASLSLRRARFVVHAVHARGAPLDVADDTQHVANTSLLLALGWLVFLVVGVLGLFNPAPAPPRAIVLWGLLSAAGVWSVMTAGDYLYTRRVWKRTTHTIQQEGPL